jgi:hypothetical protein
LLQETLTRIGLKIILAYWPSQWQAATSEETVIDVVFGVFSSREKAIDAISKNVHRDEWEEYKDQFVYETLEVDAYQPVPHLV